MRAASVESTVEGSFVSAGHLMRRVSALSRRLATASLIVVSAAAVVAALFVVAASGAGDPPDGPTLAAFDNPPDFVLRDRSSSDLTVPGSTVPTVPAGPEAGDIGAGPFPDDRPLGELYPVRPELDITDTRVDGVSLRFHGFDRTDHLAVERRAAGGEWVEVYSVPHRGRDRHLWVDTARLDLHCYRVVARWAQSSFPAYTPEKCTVRPDPANFPLVVRGGAVDWSTAYEPVGDSTVLVNLTNRKALGYGERRYGINLVWGASSSNITFQRRAGSEWSLLQGEPLAIHVDGGRWLKFREGRPNGVDLDWSDQPVYEWYVLGGEPGRQIDGEIALWNRSAGDYLVYGHQNFGINLVFLDDDGSGGQPPSGGVSSLTLYNCEADRRPLTAWVDDLQAPGGFDRVATVASQWSTSGCPTVGAPWRFEPADNHSYLVRMTDPANSGCTTDSPLNDRCLEYSTALNGDPDGRAWSDIVS